MATFTRKRVLLSFLLLLIAGCTPATFPTTIPTARPTLSATVTPTAYPTLSLDKRFRNALEIDVSCPRICWNGINPGVTSAAEARAILGDDLGKQLGDSKGGNATIEDDLVKSIYIGSSSSEIGFVMRDFVALLGDPAEIRIDFFSGMHCDPSGPFFVYYPSRKLTLFVRFSDPAYGPHLQDYVSGMVLNSEFDEGAFDNGSADTDDTISLYWYYPLDRTKHPFKRQPWLGFGHIHDYLSGRSLPACP